MTEVETPEVKTKGQLRKKFWLQFIVGMVFGALGYITAKYLVIGNIDIGSDLGGDAIIFMSISVIYFVMGLFILIGMMLPRKIAMGFLNFEDAEELDEEKNQLWKCALIFMGLSTSQILLLMTLESEYITPIIGFAAMTASYITALIITWNDWDEYDELVKKITFDASYLCLSIIATILWFWCSAAWLNWVAGPTPLALLSMINGIYLICIFIVANKHGLTKTR